MDRPLVALNRLLAVLLALPAVAPGLLPAAARADVRTLSAGSHPITLPTEAPATFRLRRTAPGSTLHVALWYVGAGDSVGEGVRLTLGTTPDDTGCGSGAVFRPTLGEPAPLLTTSASTWTDEPDHPCGTATEVFVTVGLPSDPADAGRAATLVVREEPPLSAYAFDLLREPAAPAWRPLDPDPAPQPVVAGATPENALLVEPGSLEVRLRPGRQAMVGILLDWDQSLRAQVDGSADAAVTIIGPMLGEDVASSGPGWAQTHVASYLHRNSFDPTRAGASLDGPRYVLVGLPPGSAAATVTLTLAVDGSRGDGVPAYTVPTGADGPSADPPDDSAPAPIWIGAGALVVVVVIALTRRGARARGR
ncbi:hypothetical protein [Pimelobacter simplex]|uniref:hypothetical protein n=1 Tax=Nocardioides simplex TaxID=2045 RepID=UPI00193384F3|nr:hypothetical protein [Pimelobacter simplex]